MRFNYLNNVNPHGIGRFDKVYSNSYSNFMSFILWNRNSHTNIYISDKKEFALVEFNFLNIGWESDGFLISVKNVASESLNLPIPYSSTIFSNVFLFLAMIGVIVGGTGILIFINGLFRFNIELVFLSLIFGFGALLIYFCSKNIEKYYTYTIPIQKHWRLIHLSELNSKDKERINKLITISKSKSINHIMSKNVDGLNSFIGDRPWIIWIILSLGFVYAVLSIFSGFK